MSRPLGLGLLGLGVAGGLMAAAARTHPGVRLVAAADPDPVLRDRFHTAESLPVSTDLDGLLARDDVEAVYVATPHQMHRDHVVRVCVSGRHALVEKPMALTLADCDDMAAAAADNGVALVVGHTHGFDPAVMMMRELVGSGAYGRLGMIALWRYTDFLYRPRRPEELDTRLGGGILYNQLPHQVEIARTIAARSVRSVRAVTGTLDPARPTESACTALIEFADHSCASLVYSGYDHFDTDELHDWVGVGGARKTPVHGSARRSLRGLDADDEIRLRRCAGYSGDRPVPSGPHQPHFGELVVTCADADLRCGADDVRAYTSDGLVRLPIPARSWPPGRGDVLQELVVAAAGRPVVHDGAFGRETLRVCLAVAQSAREHREIVLAPGPAEHAVATACSPSGN